MVHSVVPTSSGDRKLVITDTKNRKTPLMVSNEFITLGISKDISQQRQLVVDILEVICKCLLLNSTLLFPFDPCGNFLAQYGIIKTCKHKTEWCTLSFLEPMPKT